MVQHFPLAWEAYVAGHHGSVFGAWMDSAWEEATLGLPPARGRPAGCPGFAEMDLALRRLAVAKVVEAAVLVEVHRAIDAVRRYARRLLRAWRAADLYTVRRAYARGFRWAEVLGELGAGLLAPHAGSLGWIVLGAAVGRCRRACRNAAAGGVLPDGSGGEVLDEVRGAVGRLANASTRAVLQPLLALAPPEHDRGPHPLEEARYVHHLHLAIASADVAVLSALRGVTAPLPVLALDAERLVFHGREFRLSDIPRTQAAALWVLAESAGRPVPRAVIRSEGRIQTPENRLEEIMSRLRRQLALLVGREPPVAGVGPKEIREIIRGERGPSPHQGPYILRLSPESVRVTLPRPAWMRRP
ncbi:hypothetical protein [Urbifossiella limnaea]|uniref:Uncharacterized protein n=1 Tax=Urbifossiella limnaea TaxID=2528023 RepID=A0A517XN48_9BACT|nr:hypothetical protein [Urbifossiella limnaea]QDU18928.1 hypothetical protein ETAA1_08250 [Urbifossiella limnaea]